MGPLHGGGVVGGGKLTRGLPHSVFSHGKDMDPKGSPTGTGTASHRGVKCISYSGLNHIHDAC